MQPRVHLIYHLYKYGQCLWVLEYLFYTPPNDNYMLYHLSSIYHPGILAVRKSELGFQSKTWTFWHGFSSNLARTLIVGIYLVFDYNAHISKKKMYRITAHMNAQKVYTYINEISFSNWNTCILISLHRNHWTDSLFEFGPKSYPPMPCALYMFINMKNFDLLWVKRNISNLR